MLSRLNISLLSTLHRSVCSVLKISTYPTDTKEQMTITDDGQVIVCWHPEKSFPYECSTPLPEAEPPSSSFYKMENKEEIYKIFKNQKLEFVREELMKITHTTKHRWYPKTRSKYRKKTPRERSYL